MKKRLKKVLLLVSSLLLLFVLVFFLYVSDYYKADESAVEALNEDLKENNAIVKDDLIIIPSKIKSDTAMIFYPGGKVEATAYYPLLSRFADNGITCVLVKMPFHLAIFDPSAADRVFDTLPEIKNWFIGGHSLGGAMASKYMSENPGKLKGLILLGAYVYGDVPSSKALTIYGTKDGVLDKEKIKDSDPQLPLVGGNHANFGNYGEQKGDQEADMSREVQQEKTAEAVEAFVE
ncbi:alpha/beta hydrolase [Lacrimispora algidixylanolytica]|uniref:Alpha/beta hydrolase fold-5 domain-containing protein n=1 Tax=Lacrimispora algidixylanolytica TaxID=94868 RepID=A0A419T2J4_9FIRM|nr:alpha/beta hydrolase [Lacrimispora algidixylanolytica]RKD31727.1 hypothetical protein BET01_19585 [Lacrimispora algidixylanolytica]